jgi:predicted nucleic acid-binding protein
VIYGIDTGFMIAAEVIEHPRHSSARELLGSIISQGHRFALAPQVLAEFIHVVTDSKRFSTPLSVDVARRIASDWWESADVDQVFADSAGIGRFLEWHQRHQLGRKRLLDTLLAATYFEVGVTRVCTTNGKDFETFGVFFCVEP